MHLIGLIAIIFSHRHSLTCCSVGADPSEESTASQRLDVRHVLWHVLRRIGLDDGHDLPADHRSDLRLPAASSNYADRHRTVGPAVRPLLSGGHLLRRLLLVHVQNDGDGPVRLPQRVHFRRLRAVHRCYAVRRVPSGRKQRHVQK